MNIIELIQKHKQYLPESLFKTLSPMQKGDCTATEDLLLLYLLILETAPQHIVEFSPMLGYSTQWLATAMKVLNRVKSMISAESNASYFNTASKRIKDSGLTKYCTLLHGDAMSIVPQYISKNIWNVELAFIDSCHSYGFAKQYIAKIFPLLSPHCFIMAHDIIIGGDKFTCPLGNEKTIDTPKFQEYKALREYIMQKNLPYILTSELFEVAKFCATLNERVSPIYNEIGKILGFDWTKYLNWVSPLGLLFRLDGDL